MPSEKNAFFQNRNCEYFPCHKGVKTEIFNCMFCYCPLYPLGDRCGGTFSYTQDGIKDCSSCVLPHGPEGSRHVLARFPELAELARRKPPEQEV